MLKNVNTVVFVFFFKAVEKWLGVGAFGRVCELAFE